MQKNITRALLLGAAFVLSAGANAPAETQATPAPSAVAQATPAPKVAASSPFSYNGYVRSYYFTRQNATSFVKANSQFNQAALNPAFNLHAQYSFGKNWTIGGTYLYANPFTGCGDPKSHVDPSSSCYRSRKFIGGQGTNEDDTLPDYRLSTLYEAYLQYKDNNLYAKIGNQVINTPWANASDSRLKPVAFQGGDVSYKLSANWLVEGMYMPRWEDRATSDFTNVTLLTGTTLPSANYGGAGSNIIPKPFTYITNNGFYMGRLGYTDSAIAANAYYYAFNNIANAFWGDFKYSWKAYGKPFIALQGGTETNAGTSIIGKVNSQVIGVQGGYSPWPNVDLTVGYDRIPMKSDTIVLPAGTKCGSNNQISGLLPYFLPGGGTTNCFNNGDGTTNVYYGGWASPYTDSYATDPLFDTMISQGTVDRRSAGDGVKVSGTFYTFQKRIKVIVAHAWWSYGNGTAGVSPTQETNVDATYYFSKLGKGAYHGFSLRHRYAERTQSYTTVFGGSPDFKYNRTQLEYDF
jgi:hypothetical protein